MMTEDSYMIPVIVHNLKGYDSHLILQYVTPEYAPNSIDVIPTISEKFLTFGNLRFLDRLQFLTASLDTLVQSLAADGRENLAIPLGIIFVDRAASHRRILAAHFPKKLSLRKSTNELRKYSENSKLKTCNNITTFI